VKTIFCCPAASCLFTTLCKLFAFTDYFIPVYRHALSCISLSQQEQRSKVLIRDDSSPAVSDSIPKNSLIKNANSFAEKILFGVKWILFLITNQHPTAAL
jgi:hypothetical protein